MTIRKRIFTVIGVVIAAAFLQTLIVLEVENRRAAAAASLDRALWRIEKQADLGRLIIELDAVERSAAKGPAQAAERERLWGLYERGAALLPDSLARRRRQARGESHNSSTGEAFESQGQAG